MGTKVEKWISYMIMKDLNWFTLENIVEDRVANESVISLWAMYNWEILSMEYYTAVKRNELNHSGVSKPQTIG